MLSSKLLRSLVAVSLIGLIFGIAVHTSQPLHGASTSGSPAVTVVNSSSQPVPVTGTVTGTITGSVSVSNTPSVNIANTPAVTLSGTPTVNVGSLPAVTLSGTPDVNIAGGTVNVKPPLVSRRIVYAGSLGPGDGQDFGDFINGPIKVSTVIINSSNDITVYLFPSNTIPFEGNKASAMNLSVTGGSAHVINFQIPIEAKGLTVTNGALLAHADFTVDIIGN